MRYRMKYMENVDSPGYDMIYTAIHFAMKFKSNRIFWYRIKKGVWEWAIRYDTFAALEPRFIIKKEEAWAIPIEWKRKEKYNAS